ncbi:hypothetical protein BOX15_Mlig012262g2 [Macrostomum lignano]|uniref:Uncharacterized protein n=1 Tax=Macrostomum lignano TaxID=282301 RepID=A0A267FY77_9PLAT|nr:hypothetical protein BOX15_Mlig012262g2 [Macrostomum lignano]
MMDSLESNDDHSLQQPAGTAGAYRGLSRPIATYSPMGAADSGYQTDSPTPVTAANSSATSYTPPPGTFRPVSPAEQPAGQLRHVSTQTSLTEQILQQQPPPPPPPLLLSQQSTGFRPASAPVYDLPDVGARGGGSDVGGAFGGGGVGGIVEFEVDDLDSEFDEEVYRTAAAAQNLQPLPDLLQRQAVPSSDSGDAVRLRTRSVPVPDLASRHERVALLLREIGDQYNRSRGQSPAAAGTAGGGSGRASLQLFSHTRRDRSLSLRTAEIDPLLGEGAMGDENWRQSILGWVAQMARTLSGANIALDDEEGELEDGYQ